MLKKIPFIRRLFMIGLTTMTLGVIISLFTSSWVGAATWDEIDNLIKSHSQPRRVGKATHKYDQDFKKLLSAHQKVPEIDAEILDLEEELQELKDRKALAKEDGDQKYVPYFIYNRNQSDIDELKKKIRVKKVIIKQKRNEKDRALAAFRRIETSLSNKINQNNANNPTPDTLKGLFAEYLSAKSGSTKKTKAGDSNVLTQLGISSGSSGACQPDFNPKIQELEEKVMQMHAAIDALSKLIEELTKQASASVSAGGTGAAGGSGASP